MHNPTKPMNKNELEGNPMKPTKKPKRGRPITRKIEIHATAEEIAQVMFAAADPPDPSKRIVKRPRKE